MDISSAGSLARQIPASHGYRCDTLEYSEIGTLRWLVCSQAGDIIEMQRVRVLPCHQLLLEAVWHVVTGFVQDDAHVRL